MGDHERIWLEPACAEDERCWCSDPLDDCAEEGCGLPATEYVRADILAARDARIAEFERILSDPDAVHINMLRGTIARPSIEQVRHLYPEEFAALVRERERLRAALTEAADELDACYTAEYPTHYPHHVRKLETAKAANPARAALQEPTDAPE